VNNKRTKFFIFYLFSLWMKAHEISLATSQLPPTRTRLHKLRLEAEFFKSEISNPDSKAVRTVYLNAAPPTGWMVCLLSVTFDVFLKRESTQSNDTNVAS
jgi:hypothetical protein